MEQTNEQNRQAPTPSKGNPFMGLLWGLLIVLLLNGLVFPRFSGAQLADTDYGTFIGKVDSGLVKEVIIKNGQIYFTAEGSDRKTRTYRTGEIGDPGMVERLLKAPSPNPNGKIAFNRIIPHENSPILNFVLMWILPGLCFYLIWRQAGRSIQARLKDGGNFLSLGSSGAKIYADTDVKTTFADVAGQDEAKDALQEIVDFLHDPSKYAEIGATLPKGALLVGPPGTGKTLIARAVAGQAKVPFFAISGSEFVQMFVGMGAAKVRDLFKQAGEKAPCIIFIDEIDAVGRQRGAGLGGGNDEREQTLNQMLVEMDGFETGSNVIVIAATNRPDVLDPALLRPGRFDRQVVVPLPDIRGREQILNVHMKKVPVGRDIDVSVLARGTPGFSGADLANLVNEASLFAARRNARTVEMQDFENAKDKIMMGAERRGVVMNEHERRNTAYHESGHAVVARLLPKADPVHKVTIIPRGRALGVTMQLPTEDRYSYDRETLLTMISIMFGGRIAEEVFMNQATTGASNDFERATHLARDMVTRYGMSDKMGPMVYAENEGEVFLGRSVTRTTHVSEATMQQVDAEIRRILDERYEVAKKLIVENSDKMHAMAEALLKWETIDSDQIDDIMAGREVRPPKSYDESKATEAKAEGAARSEAAETPEARSDEPTEERATSSDAADNEEKRD